MKPGTSGSSKPVATQWLDAVNPATREAAIDTAATILGSGGLVAFPTETVYGLGADALNEQAVKNIFRAKGRPADNPLIVHVSSLADAMPLVREVPEKAKVLADIFWPGPLTMVLSASGAVPRVVTAGLDTVGIRIPRNETARALIRRAGVPVAAPSANASGNPSTTTAAHVYDDLNGRIDAILDGGSCQVGIESTVLDLTGPVPVILRHGGVSPEDLQPYLPDLVVPPAQEQETAGIPRAPGMKYRHYAPKARLLLVDGETERVVATIRKEAASWQSRGHRVGILAGADHAEAYKAEAVRVLGSRGAPDEAARNLFALLRELDQCGVDVILAEGIPPEGLGVAIMNRLWKACGGDVIHAR